MYATLPLSELATDVRKRFPVKNKGIQVVVSGSKPQGVLLSMKTFQDLKEKQFAARIDRETREADVNEPVFHSAQTAAAYLDTL